MTQPLTGEALLAMVKESGDCSKEELLEKSGYEKFEDLYEELLLATGDQQSQKASERTTAFQHMSVIGAIGYRYLVYQYDLDNGFEDTILATQQIQFCDQLEAIAKKLQVLLPDEAGMALTDLIGVITQLFAYNEHGKYDKGEKPNTSEEDWREILKWTRATPAFQKLKAIADEGYSAEDCKAYEDGRFDYHSLIATYLRTVTIDFLRNTNHQAAPSFGERLHDAKAFLAMLDENCQHTKEGIIFALCSSMQYHHRTEKDTQELAGFAMPLVEQWVADGHEFLAKVRGKTNDNEAPIDPVESLDDWYVVTDELTVLNAAIEALREVKENTENSENFELFQKKFDELMPKWLKVVKRALTAEKPLRDNIVRAQAYAAAAMNLKGGDTSTYQTYFNSPLLSNEYEVLMENLSEEEASAQKERANNEFLLKYIGAFSHYYCNKLLNIADGGSREEATTKMDVGKDLKALTSILEDQKLFDEMYLVRTTTMNTIYGCMGNLLVDPGAGYKYRVKAQEMLMEFYSEVKVPEAT